MLTSKTLPHSIAIQVLSFLFSIFLSPPLCQASNDSEPTLTIRHAQTTQTFTRSELLKRKDLEQLSLDDSPTYPGRKVTFSAIPLTHLFGSEALGSESTVLFRCQDGFSAPMEKDRLLNEKKTKAIAYIAVEDPESPWPKIKAGDHTSSPGPFYLVWKNAQASKIQTEEWPYQVVQFEVKPSLRESYPEIYPSKTIPKEHKIMRGMKVFTQNCFTCHTLNLQGDSHFGPDLNLPHSPVEYFQEPYLRKFIRNPQEVRRWKEDRMKGFNASEISDPELSNLIEYLRHMAHTRRPKRI